MLRASEYVHDVDSRVGAERRHGIGQRPVCGFAEGGADGGFTGMMR